MNSERKDKIRRKPRRLGAKEQKEQDLLSALDAVYDAEDKLSEKQERAIDTSAPTRLTNPPVLLENEGQVVKPLARKSNANSPKVVVYIDGENTFYQLFDVLRRARLVKYREDLVKFDMVWLLEQVLGGGEKNYRYYGSKLKEETGSPDLLQRTQRMIDHKRRWIGYLSNQGIEFIAAGSLKIRDISGPTAKEPELTFAEKGIDVRIAVDLVEASMLGQLREAIVWSSDADLKPVMLSAKSHGAKVVYLAREGRINDVLAGSVSETKTISESLIKEAFKKAN